MSISPASLTRSKIGAKCETILVGNRIKAVWYPKVGCHLVKLPDGPEHYKTKDEAIAAAGKFRDLCREAEQRAITRAVDGVELAMNTLEK